MNVLKCISFALFLGLAQTGFSATVTNTEISKIAIDRGLGDRVFVKTAGSKTNPSCHSSTSWTFVMPLVTEAEKSMYSALLAAKSAGRKVTLGGTDTCSSYTGIETLSRIEVL